MNSELVEKYVSELREAWQDDLVSAVPCASAAFDDFLAAVSDFNLFCVLSKLGPSQLESAFEATAWWISKKQQPPVLLTVNEVSKAADYVDRFASATS